MEAIRGTVTLAAEKVNLKGIRLYQADAAGAL